MNNQPNPQGQNSMPRQNNSQMPPQPSGYNNNGGYGQPSSPSPANMPRQASNNQMPQAPMPQSNNQAVAVANNDRGMVSYNVGGQDVELSYQIVRDFLTKGSGTVSDQDLTLFINICKYNLLNPFLNEAYLVKFGSAPAQMIVSREALMKRAEQCESYEGVRGGIIVVRDGNVIDLEGCFKLKDDELVGGWAEVYRSDRRFPIISRVTLSEYDKKQSIWLEKPSTMISKVAKVQALREAFPAQLGAMYTEEESKVIDVDAEDVTHKIDKNANKQTISINGTVSTNTLAIEVDHGAQPIQQTQAPAQPMGARVMPSTFE